MHLTIDPGINIGWALWDVKTWKRLCEPAAYGAVSERLKKEPDWATRMFATMDAFKTRMDEALIATRLRNVYVEWPEFDKGSHGQLRFAAGLLCEWARAMGGTAVLLGVNEWKGQLKKRHTDARIRERLGASFLQGCGSHTRDAVGMGLHCKGYTFGD